MTYSNIYTCVYLTMCPVLQFSCLW